MTATYFESLPFRCNLETGLIDYDRLEENALLYRPKVIVAGTSAYCRNFDYPRFRQICDKAGCYFMVDMAHIVTTTTHKSLRGPRGAMIFMRKGVRKTDPKTGKQIMYDLEEPINFSVFPGHQGGPHNHTITALAVALKQAQTDDFKQYQQQVIKNAKAMEEEFTKLGHTLVTGGTDNHMVLLDLKPHGVDGGRLEYVLEHVNIACNKNTTPADKSALSPMGIRIGAPAMTSRGMSEEDFKRIVRYFDKCIGLVKEIQGSLPKEANKLKDFKAKVAAGGNETIDSLKKEIVEWACSFPLPV